MGTNNLNKEDAARAKKPRKKSKVSFAEEETESWQGDRSLQGKGEDMNFSDSNRAPSQSVDTRKQRLQKITRLKTFSVRNRLRRQELYQKQKFEKSKIKREERMKRKKEAEKLGDQAPPKQTPKTLENLRVPDETIVSPEDEEVLCDEKADEFGSYFNCEVVPKILITVCNKPRSYETLLFIDDLVRIIPNSEYHYRKGIELKKIIPQAKERGFTAIIIVNEDHKKANALLISHLPDGPTAHFKLSSVQRCKQIKHHGKSSIHRPELVLNNFNSRLGHSIGRLLAALFPFDPQFQGRRVVTFHNQRDFVFFRHHRYIFKNAKKVGLQEIGPRFTLKLRSLQKGTFDSKYGEYEWIHKRKEMDTSRRKFHL